MFLLKLCMIIFFFFKQKTAYEMRISDWSSDVCSSDLWERGVGLTRACGTGACATAVAAIRRHMVQRPVEVRLPGGSLTVDWEPGGRIRMSGPATHVFTGEIDLETLG